MLLRSHLQRAQRGERKSVAAPSRSGPSQTPIERVQNLLRDEELPEPEVERALVRGLLMHEFGTDVSNDAKFQTIVEDVLAMIRRDESANRLLKLAIRQLAER
jgi:hypothetical protein